MDCWVLPKGNHSSDFIIKRVQQFMTLPASWSAPETCSGSMMCSWSPSFWATNFLFLLNGTTYWNCTKSVSSVVQAVRCPPEPHCTEQYESGLGCTRYEPYCCSRHQHSWVQVRTTALYAMNYILLWKKWLMRITRASFKSYHSQNSAMIKQTSLSSFITYDAISIQVTQNMLQILMCVG
jgi:hypothetical protein